MDKKEIKFIDSSYNELFKIPDGSQILITYENGEKRRATCKYIDDYHTEIDGRCYHICQWAELIEQNGRACVPATASMYSLENINQEEFEFMYATFQKRWNYNNREQMWLEFERRRIFAY